MAGETIVTVIGNVVEDQVDLRFTPSGAAVAKFTVASTPRTYDKQAGAWRDGETLYLKVSVWRQQAEHCGETLARGMRVVVQGRLSQRSYEDKQQVKRTVYELEGDEVAVSLRSATARVTKAGGSGQGQGQGQARQAARGQMAQGNASNAADPWASSGAAAQAAQAGAWGGDEPPPF